MSRFSFPRRVTGRTAGPRLACAALLLAAAPLHAEQFRFDLGMVDAPACVTREYRYQRELEAQVPQNRYSPRKARLTATVVAFPFGERDTQLLQACADDVAGALRDARSLANVRMFERLYAERLRACLRTQDAKIKIREVYVDAEERCAN